MQIFFGHPVANWDNEDWKEDEGKTFSLPPNCKDVFFMMFHKMIYGYGIVVVFDDKIAFYEWQDTGWQENNDLVFYLPKNCQGVFDFTSRIGIIVDNKIQFFSYDNAQNTWIELPNLEYTLPQNCQGVFEYGYAALCIIGDKKIKIIDGEFGNWIEVTNAEFNLPDNFKGTFYISLDWLVGFGLTNDIGIVTDKKILFYRWSGDNGWVNLSNAEFDFAKFNIGSN